MSRSPAPKQTTRSFHNSAGGAALLRRRHAAEWRLKAYGILALGIAFLALILLLASVVGKARLALTETYATLPVTLDQALLDPDKSGNPEIIGKGDFDKVADSAIRAAFPEVSGRSDKKALTELLSQGGSIDLRKHVMGQPGLIGSDVEFPFLMSDLADLYVKGDGGRLQDLKTAGSLTLTRTGDIVTLNSSEADFLPALEMVQVSLQRDARLMREKAALQENGRLVYAQRAEAATDEAEKTKLADEAAKREQARDELLAEAATMEIRAADATATEQLGEDHISLLARVDQVWVRLDSLSANWATGSIVGADAGTATAAPGEWQLLLNPVPESERKLSDHQIIWIEQLREKGAVSSTFNARFFSAGDSREPELAGIFGAAAGSFWTMLVTFALSFPIGVMAAIYLEEFAPKNRMTGFIEVNINNLAAVPSIVFGLLGLAVFLGFFGVPRSAPLAGGIVLALMTLPTVIIAARTAIRAVPPSIRDAALGVGASKLQTSFHHVLPLAMPGIMTGMIIGMARALGETAPLIMIGMVAFIVDIPRGITSSATVLPVQIYRWSDFPERAFEARTAAAICVLLGFLILMNAIAVFLRNRFERRW